MLDRVRHVDRRPIDPGALERTIEQGTRRANEGPTLHILPIPRLLADQHHLRGRRSLTEDGLCRINIEVTTTAVHGSRTQ
jgi:hypothetical protein